MAHKAKKKIAHMSKQEAIVELCKLQRDGQQYSKRFEQLRARYSGSLAPYMQDRLVYASIKLAPCMQA